MVGAVLSDAPWLPAKVSLPLAAIVLPTLGNVIAVTCDDAVQNGFGSCSAAVIGTLWTG